jgi:hypothetical protein
MLDQAHLPPQAVTDLFRGQLLSAATTEARKAMIQERRGLLDSLSRLPNSPISQERQGDGLDISRSRSDEQLIHAIRRR